MKKFMLILVVLSMFGCARPVSEPDVEEPIVVTNPFIGTWKNMTGESIGYNIGFIFRDDGTFDYWFSLGNTSGSGNYTYNNEWLIFSNGKITNDELIYRKFYELLSEQYNYEIEKCYSNPEESDIKTFLKLYENNIRATISHTIIEKFVDWKINDSDKESTQNRLFDRLSVKFINSLSKHDLNNVMSFSLAVTFDVIRELYFYLKENDLISQEENEKYHIYLCNNYIDEFMPEVCNELFD